MKQQEKRLKEALKKYPFLQNIHFCKLVDVPQSTVKMWLAGKRPLAEKSFKMLSEAVYSLLPHLEKLKGAK